MERATFYRHFRHLDDLIADTVGHLADQRLSELRDARDGEKEPRVVEAEIFTAYLEHIAEHWRLYRWALWQQRSGATFIALLERMRSGSAMGLDGIVLDSDLGVQDDRLLAGFAAGGMLGGILEWLRDDEPEQEPEQLAARLFSASGLGRSPSGTTVN
ncbi:TetR/AcrR family transcriptional regulator [Brachybacterium paraconglomeratum]|uniref:TetR/AcrR family transcriptional regulator n=1 Tax=Brachybacterium paraconglomeratum TaxID=173362 RepID=UPI0037C87426